MIQATAPVLLYNGFLVPSSLAVELFLRATSIPYQLVSDSDLEFFEYSQEHCLFIFPPGGNNEPVPIEALGGGNGIGKLRQAISNGMNYLGICFGAYAAMNPALPPEGNGLKLINGHHRWAVREDGCAKDGLGALPLTFKVNPTFAKAVGVQEYTSIHYHNGPIISQDSLMNYTTLISFAPTRSERKQLSDLSLFRKHLTGVPAVFVSNFGKGRVMLCSPHLEYGDVSYFQWRDMLLEWMRLEEIEGTEEHPLIPGSLEYEKLLLGCTAGWMSPIRESANWRILTTLVNDLLVEH